MQKEKKYSYRGDPWSIAKLFSYEKWIIFLDSCNKGTTSMLALYPQKTMQIKNNILYVKETAGSTSNPTKMRRISDGFKELEKIIKATRHGRWFGYLAYPLVKYVENIKMAGSDPFPDMFFMLPKVWIEFKKNRGVMIIHGEEKDALAVMKKIKISKKKNVQRTQQTAAITNINCNFTKQQYLQAINQAKEYIFAGDSFQVKLSQRFSFDNKDHFNSMQVYENLREINPSPYSAFVRLNDLEILSCSPEHLISRRRNNINTTPIGGTCSYAQNKNKKENSAIIKKFLSDEKERAEHIMLIDLERNDLSRVCKSGTVKVDKQMQIEKYSHLAHIVTNIKGELHKSKTTIDLIRAVFPGGTVTGCPKIRTMQIINELEKTNRSLYTGSLGWIDANSDCTFNILIRSMFINRKKNNGFLQVGGGIVADSQPEREYQETLWKAQALFKSVGVYYDSYH